MAIITTENRLPEDINGKIFDFMCALLEQGPVEARVFGETMVKTAEVLKHLNLLDISLLEKQLAVTANNGELQILLKFKRK